MLLVPSALAAPTLQADLLAVDGTSELRGDAAALFALAEALPFSWELTAAGGQLHREYSTYTAVDHPLMDTYLFDQWTEYQSEDVGFAEIALRSTGVDAGGALLLLSSDGVVAATSDRFVTIHSERDPEIRQSPPSRTDFQTEGGDDGYLRWTLYGDHLNATLHGGAATVVGDITLVLYGPSYERDAAGETTALRTGKFEEENNGATARGSDERHTYFLQDAVFRFRTPESVVLYTQFPELAFQGSARAEGADGALALGGADLHAGAWTWTGEATLSLSPAAGRILATTPEPIVAASALVTQGPQLALVSSVLVLSFAAAFAAFILWRRRARGDLDAALLAMEERRWNDALPHLTLIAKREPANAGVQIDRALCLEQVGRFGEAAKAFEAALRSAPQHAEAHFYYARTLAKMRESEAARVHLEAALERDPRLVEMARRETVLKGL